MRKFGTRSSDLTHDQRREHGESLGFPEPRAFPWCIRNAPTAGAANAHRHPRTAAHAVPHTGCDGVRPYSNGGLVTLNLENKLFVHSRYTVMIPSGIPEKKEFGRRLAHAFGSNAPCKGPSVPIHSYEQFFSIYSHYKILNFSDVLFTSRLIGAPIYWVVLLSQKRESKIFGSDKRVPCQIMCCSPMC